jgi:hypothetical protein
VIAIVACSTSPHVCTLVDCDSGLIVHVLGIENVTGIEAESRGGAVYKWECSPTTGCGNDPQALFSDFRPSIVRIRVIAGSDTTTREFEPVYEAWRPNGPDCDPVCWLGTVTVTP